MNGKKAAIALVITTTLLFSGCATTYIPVSWGMGERVQRVSRTDPTLTILFKRYDPERRTLRVIGDSFDEATMPSEVKHRLGAYRFDSQLIYRNLYLEYSDEELRNLMVHEFAHHIWFTRLSPTKRLEWKAHLERHPSPWQHLVRRVYNNPATYDAEDFAFTVEFAREADIEMLVRLKVISDVEGDELRKVAATADFAEEEPFPNRCCHDMSNTLLFSGKKEESSPGVRQRDREEN